MTKIVTVPTKPMKRKRDRTQPVNWYAPEDRRITEEMVNVASVAMWRKENGGLRAALEAVAPMLIAQGMQKSAYMYRDWLAMQSNVAGTFDTYLNFQANELEWRSKGEFVRAQELDPQ